MLLYLILHRSKMSCLGGNTVDSSVLSVGEMVHLKQGKDHIIYAGMASEDVYSIAQMCRQSAIMGHKKG